MSRNKKILIGVGIVVILGGAAYANVKFKQIGLLNDRFGFKLIEE